ncbi:MAG: PQQ-binding-like beta-propeller repeat protein [Bacteroidales bacterium]
MKSKPPVKTHDHPDPVNFRIRPAIIIVSIQWMLWLIIPALIPGDTTTMIRVFGGFAGGLAVLIWWLFFSRVPLLCRWVALILMILSTYAVTRLADPSITTSYQGMMIFNYIIPFLSLALVLWATFSQKLSLLARRLTLIAGILVASGIWTLFRSEGITGSGGAELAWRWSKTYEEKFNEQKKGDGHASIHAETAPEERAQWPGFRGPNRDGVVHGLQVDADWASNPPKELWRRMVGPACSSFAVQGDLLYTQEQRENNEAICCYRLSNGEPVWIYQYEARFWDSHAGAGPRSTPTLSRGQVYTLGATGLLNVLDAKKGRLLWSRNPADELKVELPGWGFSASPLVVDDLVIVALGGTIIAYDIESGEPRWTGPEGGKGYSSPHLFTIDGINQVVMLNENGVTSFEPSDGHVIWEYENKEERIVQPSVTPEGQLLISTRMGTAVQCLALQHDQDSWSIREQWSSNKLKPNFNDFVVHNGYAFGFDGVSLACINLTDGTRMWKSGRYGGQVILLADQDLLIILSEKGELVLVKAIPDQFIEMARFPAIEGKTWNHPVLAGDILLVRNTREMVAYRLSII